MICKLFLCCCHNISFYDPKRFDQFDQKENELDAADDGEPTQEPHGASDQTQLGVKLDFLVSLDLVKGCRGKVDLHQVKRGLRQRLS